MVAEPSESSGPEHILCDTGVVSLIEVSRVRPESTAHWPLADRKRLDRAVLAINPFVLGEVRSGRVRANWGQARIDQAEKAIAAYLFVPLDFDVLDAFVDIRSRFFSQMGDNDMWIAATAKARDWPLATCDLDYCRLKEEMDLIYLPSDTNAPTECP